MWYDDFYEMYVHDDRTGQVWVGYIPELILALFPVFKPIVTRKNGELFMRVHWCLYFDGDPDSNIKTTADFKLPADLDVEEAVHATAVQIGKLILCATHTTFLFDGTTR